MSQDRNAALQQARETLRKLETSDSIHSFEQIVSTVRSLYGVLKLSNISLGDLETTDETVSCPPHLTPEERVTHRIQAAALRLHFLCVHKKLGELASTDDTDQTVQTIHEYLNRQLSALRREAAGYGGVEDVFGPVSDGPVKTYICLLEAEITRAVTERNIKIINDKLLTLKAEQDTRSYNSICREFDTINTLLARLRNNLTANNPQDQITIDELADECIRTHANLCLGIIEQNLKALSNKEKWLPPEKIREIKENIVYIAMQVDGNIKNLTVAEEQTTIKNRIDNVVNNLDINIIGACHEFTGRLLVKIESLNKLPLANVLEELSLEKIKAWEKNLGGFIDILKNLGVEPDHLVQMQNRIDSAITDACLVLARANALTVNFNLQKSIPTPVFSCTQGICALFYDASKPPQTPATADTLEDIIVKLSHPAIEQSVANCREVRSIREPLIMARVAMLRMERCRAIVTGAEAGHPQPPF